MTLWIKREKQESLAKIGAWLNGWFWRQVKCSASIGH